MRTYTIVVEPDQDGGYFVTVPALPGCFTRGCTIEECRERAVGPSRFTSQVFRPTASPFPRKSGRRDFWPSPSQPDVKAPVPPPALAGAGSSASLSGMRDSNGDHRCQRLPMSPAHQNGPLILTLHDGCTHSAHRAYSTAPRVRALRAAIPLLPGMMRLRPPETTWMRHPTRKSHLG